MENLEENFIMKQSQEKTKMSVGQVGLETYNQFINGICSFTKRQLSEFFNIVWHKYKKVSENYLITIKLISL